MVGKWDFAREGFVNYAWSRDQGFESKRHSAFAGDDEVGDKGKYEAESRIHGEADGKGKGMQGMVVVVAGRDRADSYMVPFGSHDYYCVSYL